MIELLIGALVVGTIAHRVSKTTWCACNVRGRHSYSVELRWYPPGHPNHFGQTTVLAKCRHCRWWYTSTYDGRIGTDYQPSRGISAETVSIDMGRARTRLDQESVSSGAARGSFDEVRAALQ